MPLQSLLNKGEAPKVQKRNTNVKLKLTANNSQVPIEEALNEESKGPIPKPVEEKKSNLESSHTDSKTPISKFAENQSNLSQVGASE